jgi:hypothetical protein
MPSSIERSVLLGVTDTEVVLSRRPAGERATTAQ